MKSVFRCVRSAWSIFELHHHWRASGSAQIRSGIPQEVPLILPDSYEEGLKYLDGAKRFKLGEQTRKNC
jgi:hypothetical protein